MAGIECDRDVAEDGNEGDAQYVEDENGGRRGSVGRMEPAVFVDERGDRICQEGDEGRRGDRQKEDHLQRIGQGPGDLVPRPLRDHPGEGRQSHRPDRDPEHAQGEVHDPEGVVQPGDAALLEARHEHGIDQDVDSLAGQADDDRQEQGHGPDELGVAEIQMEFVSEPFLNEPGQLDAELHQPPDRDPQGQAIDGIDSPLSEKGEQGDRSQDRKQVEKRRGERWNEECALGIEVAHRPGAEGDEQEEGKDDRGQAPREFDLAGDVLEAVGDEFRQPGREEDPGDGDGADDEQEGVEDVGREQVLGVLALGSLGGQDRHEGRRQGVFGEEVPEEVGDPERGVERVHGEARAEEVAQDDFADEAHHPADRRADGEGPDALRDVRHVPPFGLGVSHRPLELSKC